MSAKFWKECRLLPNLLTLSRVLLVPVIAALMVAGRPRGAFIVFLVAGATDVLDGLAARICRQKSRLGLWLDPIADKLLITACFVLLGLPAVSHPNHVPFAVLAIVIGRDVLIAVGAVTIYLLRRQRAFFPTLLGKVSTVAQVLTVLAVLAANAWGVTPGLLARAYDVTVVATLASGVQYFVMSLPMLKDRKRAA